MSLHRPPRAALLGGAVAAWLVVAPVIAGAAPVISGADGDQWNTAPTYTVTPDADATATAWAASNRQSNGAIGGVPYVVVLDPVAEGAHTLTIVQTRPGARIETAVRRFVVDRTAPAAVRLAGPATVSAGTPFGVSWSGQEAGAAATVTVLASDADALRPAVVPPTPATGSRADIAGLPTGRYVVQVVQTDGAGNAGAPAALAVEIVAGAAPPAVVPVPPVAPATPAAPPALVAPIAPTVTVLKLPALRTTRLQPRRASVVGSRRPVLRWSRGPAGTTLYNVQLFRVGTPRADASSNAVPLRKVRSVFPRTRQVRTPTLVRGACYVWRVWPFKGATFTRTPLGVSHFCVAARAT